MARASVESLKAQARTLSVMTGERYDIFPSGSGLYWLARMNGDALAEQITLGKKPSDLALFIEGYGQGFSRCLFLVRASTHRCTARHCFD